jgi:hypothetical protein
MNLDNLFTKETTIKVSVVTLDNKKLTKSIFNQLQVKKPFDKLYNIFDGVKFLGYVNDKKNYAVFTFNDKIYKCEMVEFQALKYIDLHKDLIKTLYRVYPSEELQKLNKYNPSRPDEYYADSQISQVFSVDGQRELIEKAENLDKIFNELVIRQIFI